MLPHALRPSRVLPGLAAAALVLSTAACGASGVPAGQATPVGYGATSGSLSTAAPTAPGGLATASTSLGTVVTSDGFTLYRFDKDKAKPPTTTCTAACATSWPPVLGDGVPAVTGVDPKLIGTVGRPDGTQQLTLNGWPLYRFAKDTAPGDVKGEGVSSTWHAIGTSGKPAATPAPAPASSGYGGY